MKYSEIKRKLKKAGCYPKREGANNNQGLNFNPCKNRYIMKVEVIIQKGDNRYEAVINPDKDYNFSFSLFGEGTTVDETIANFLVCRDEMKTLFEDENRVFPNNLEFVYKYDLASFLSAYSKIISLAGLERLTGVAQGQLSHYLNGHRNPTRKTIEKIERNLHNFANELSQVHFI